MPDYIFVAITYIPPQSNLTMLDSVLKQYNINETLEVQTLKGGLINSTWKLIGKNKQYILQKVNGDIFSSPTDIARNIKNIGDYLHLNYPNYFFVGLLPTINGDVVCNMPDNGSYRLFPFVIDSVTYSALNNPQLAYEAAVQFGRFANHLSRFPVESLHIPLPNFHDLSLRFTQFENILVSGNPERISEAAESIVFLKKHSDIVAVFEGIKQNPNFKIRVMHHDTKVNNVLFDKDNKGLCVIDLDTVMPGYFMSDVGDMMRTYLSPVSEEEKDFSLIEVREDYFKAILEGYLSEMKGELSTDELKHFVYAGKFLIYMQALRFLTDYLQNDTYYGSQYPGHNFIRANNQIVLLQKLIEKEAALQDLVRNY